MYLFQTGSLCILSECVVCTGGCFSTQRRGFGYRGGAYIISYFRQHRGNHIDDEMRKYDDLVGGLVECEGDGVESQ